MLNVSGSGSRFKQTASQLLRLTGRAKPELNRGSGTAIQMQQMNLLGKGKKMHSNAHSEQNYNSAENDMEQTILNHITFGVVFLNSRRYRDAFERLMIHLIERNLSLKKDPLYRRTKDAKKEPEL